MQLESAQHCVVVVRRGREMDRADLEPVAAPGRGLGVEEASRGSADEPDGETRTAGGGGRGSERRGGGAVGRRCEERGAYAYAMRATGAERLIWRRRE